MPTVLRAHGLRFIMFVDDHPPPHVHVFGDGEAKIAIGDDAGPPEVVYAVDMSGAVQRRARRVVAENRPLLLQQWAQVHDRVN